jgi:2-oxoglutarate ferredoxin oxidoreductase subunit alpha
VFLPTPRGGWSFDLEKINLTIEICGMSGDGTIAAGGLLNQALSDAGFSVIAFDSYPAEIRGFGRCVTRSRFGDTQQIALSNITDVLISLDDVQSRSRIPFLGRDAVVIFDNNPGTTLSEDESIAAHVKPTMKLVGVPFADLASGASGSTRGRNMTALGAFAGLFGLPPDIFRKVITGKFQSKGSEVVDANVKCFDAGWEYAMDKLEGGSGQHLDVEGLMDETRKVLLSGNVAVAEGALAAGLKNYFGYPITPATPIMEYIAKKLPAQGGRMTQMEDEISAVGAVLGSFYAGGRAMTATSGPGFALMTELITHGIVSETPAVIVDVQRGGPSTGLPTKTEQSDLLSAVFGGPGDSPRIVIAPTNVTECFKYTVRSFQLAEKYQVPVIVLTDFFLGNRVENVEMPVATSEHTADWNVYPDGSSGGKLPDTYRRFEITESGISPRALPGSEGYIFQATGLEHSEKGLPDYMPENHDRMSRKRRDKVLKALADLDTPIEYSAAEKLEVGVIGWGSTFGSVLEAVNLLQDEGLKVGALKITSIYPYHEKEIRSFIERCDEVLIPELNFQGQLAILISHLFRREAIRLNMATGVPIFPSIIAQKIKDIIGVKNR